MIDKIILISFGITVFNFVIRIIHKKWKELTYDLIAIFPFLIILTISVFKPHLEFLRSAAWGLLFGPAFYIYIRGMTGYKIKLIDSVHLIPFATIAVTGVILKQEAFHLFGIEWLFKLINLLIMAFYTFIIFLLFKRHRTQIRNKYSNLNAQITMNWFKFFIFSMFIYFLFTLCMMLLNNRIFHMTREETTGIHLLITSIFLIVFDLLTIRQSFIPLAPESDENTAESQKYEKSKISPHKMKEIIRNLNRIMNDLKPFTDPDFSLDRLSEISHYSRYKISQALNLGIHKSFYDYVNEFRVEEFKRQISLSDNSYLSLLGIAYNCGFKSKSSFNAVFKKMTGTTPSELKKQMSEKSELIS